MSPTKHLVLLGDARGLDCMAPESVHLVVTSPPYWQLKDYGHENQIGFGEDYSAYINNLNVVWANCIRALKPGCRMCVNIGDQFARAVVYGRYKVISIQSEIIRFCEHMGLDYMGTIIWRKVTNTHTTGGAVIMGSFPHPRNGIVKVDYEYILLFKKPGKTEPPSKAAKEEATLTTDEWNEYFSGHWNFSGERQQAHLAPFPVELPRRLIKMFTFPGEVVLDPFAGSGTTALAAAQLGRHSIGCEINPECREVIHGRFQDESNLFSELEIAFEQGPAVRESEELWKGLPYIYSDPHQMDMKIDPRKFRFGSRVANGDVRGSREYEVVDVVDNVIVLDTGLRVRPLGVKSLSSAMEQLLNQLVKLAINGTAALPDGTLAATVTVGGRDLKDFLQDEPVADESVAKP